MNFSQLIIIFASIFGTSWAYTQEIILYDNVDQTGTSFLMQEHVPDTSFVGIVRSFCTRGFWSAYTETNYGGLTINYHGQNESLYCINSGGFEYKSFRHGGSSETTVQAISLYPEPAYHGEELLITQNSATQLNAKSLLFTGGSSWTLYEGQDFTGRFCCVGTSSAYLQLGVDGEFNVVTALKLDQVGSIVKGCPAILRHRHRHPGSATIGQRSYSTCYDPEN